MPEHLIIYTIGHSDHTTAAFVDLLRCYEISWLVDVRSQPYSRWAYQFNRENLVHDLEAAGISYRYMGDVLGGRPANPEMYDAGEERPNYRRMEETPSYQAGIDRLLELARKERVVVMCSEGDYRHCHRHLLIAETLLARDVHVQHIQPDGSTAEPGSEPQQLSLF